MRPMRPWPRSTGTVPGSAPRRARARRPPRALHQRRRLRRGRDRDLALASGPASPVTLGFLPEVHVVALSADRLVGSYEEAWSLLRARGPLPRTINWITGPSRSADIEQTLQLGAHGPVRLGDRAGLAPDTAGARATITAARSRR
ncbi:MAG: LUD domain-containing protein [Halofilum sp. (in: g-proteobacteria)]|nr:LUD domain-containing protein [Halofilum sp. (in: g-proteobacteria)]